MISNKARRKIDQKYEEVLYRKTKELLDDYSIKLEKEEKEKLYIKLKGLFEFFFNKLFKTNHTLTEDEIIKRLKKINVSNEIILKAKKLVSFLKSVEYNNLSYTKEELAEFIEETKHLLDLIYINRRVNTLSLQEGIQGLKQKIINRKFINTLKKLKTKYKEKKELPQKLVIKAMEYYVSLSSNYKEEYSREYHFYCKNLPYFMQLIDEVKKIGNDNQEELHQVISEINKIYLKFTDEQKKDLEGLIINAIDTHEQKLNIFIMIGYNHLHSKNLKDINEIYKHMLNHYNLLDSDKKRYYQGVIKRFLERYEATIKKI